MNNSDERDYAEEAANAALMREEQDLDLDAVRAADALRCPICLLDHDAVRAAVRMILPEGPEADWLIGRLSGYAAALLAEVERVTRERDSLARRLALDFEQRYPAPFPAGHTPDACACPCNGECWDGESATPEATP